MQRENMNVKTYLGFLIIIVACLLPALMVKGEIQVEGDLLREITLHPGETYEGEIMVANPGGEPTGFEVTRNDYLFYADGSSKYPLAGTANRSNASWIKLSVPPGVTLNPGDSFPLNFEVQVPEDSSLAGTYWSMIMIQ